MMQQEKHLTRLQGWQDFGYPGGPKVDRLAKIGKETYVDKIPYPKVDGFNFSFSGIKTAIINLVHNSKEEIRKEDLCISFEKVVADVLIEKIRQVLEDRKSKTIVVAGGVSANTYIRSRIDDLKKEGIEVYYPPLKLCTDNAAMIAAQRIL